MSTKSTSTIDGNLQVDGLLRIQETKVGNEVNEINVNRGVIGFSHVTGDENHLIYNNYRGLFNSEPWDGMVIRAYEGLRVYTGKGQRKLVMEVLPEGVKATNFLGAFKIGNVSDAPSESLAGTLKYENKDGGGSKLSICMRDGQNNYIWKTIVEES